MERDSSFKNAAAVFATSIVSGALIQLEKIPENGNFKARYNASEIQGNDARGRQLVALDIIFDERVHVNASCEVHCVDGKWQYGTASILLLDELESYEKFHRNFCGRLNALGALEVYEL